MSKRPTKFYFQNEKEVMSRLGLKPTKGSGSCWIEREDGQNDFLIAQLKSTDAESIKLNLHDIHKLEYNAIIAHKVPVFMVQFLQSNELFLVVKPADISTVAKYLDTGAYDIISKNFDVEEFDIPTPEGPKLAQRVIKSSSKARERFHKEREEAFKCRNKK